MPADRNTAARCARRDRTEGVWCDREEADICPRCGSRVEDITNEPEFCALYAALLTDLEDTEHGSMTHFRPQDVDEHRRGDAGEEVPDLCANCGRPFLAHTNGRCPPTDTSPQDKPA